MESLCIYGLVIALAILFAKAVEGCSGQGAGLSYVGTGRRYSSPPLSWCAIDGFVLDVFGSTAGAIFLVLASS